MCLPVYILYSVRQNLLYDQSDLNVLFLALGLSLSLHLVKSLDLHSLASLIPSPMCSPVYILYSVRQNFYMTWPIRFKCRSGREFVSSPRQVTRFTLTSFFYSISDVFAGIHPLYSVRQNLSYDQSDLNVLFLALGLSLSLRLIKSLDLHSPTLLPTIYNQFQKGCLIKSLDLHSPASFIPFPMCLPVYIHYTLSDKIFHMTNQI